jgi:MraZ protein
MPSNDSIEAIYYNSLYRHGVDDKRRVQIPAKWLPTAGSVEFTLIVWRHNEIFCLRALPPKEMAELLVKLKAMEDSSPEKKVLKRLIGSKSVQVAADKAGRICLPDDMAKAAGIKSEAMLVGLLDRFEIWNPEAYAKVQAADEVMAHEAFKLME